MRQTLEVVVAALVRAGAAVGGEVEAELDLEAAELDSSAAEVDLVATEVDPTADPQLAESCRGTAGRGKALRWRRRWVRRYLQPHRVRLP